MARPNNIADMKQRLADFRSAEAKRVAAEFIARPSDVFVSTYPKSGTTWMQQVVHQLRTGGSMAFSEISEVVPWLESAVDMGIDPEAEQTGKYRAFKCHLLYRDIPKGGRYISVFRDPITVLPSFFHFFEGWWFTTGSITIEEFAREMYMHGSASGQYWDHLIDWWQKIQDPDSLILCYEDMLLAPERVPAVVADFLQLELDDATLATVVQNCSRAFMLKHSNQFDEHLIRLHRDAVWGLPADGDSSKVADRKQSVRISKDLAAELTRLWEQTVGASLGFKTYTELRNALPNILGVSR